ncbi:MAG: DNA polymerase III subunit chi [Syntrophobacteria bacterium]
MTEILFVEVTAGSLEFKACEIAERIYARGHRLQLVASGRKQAVSLDELLWSFRPDSFVPHIFLEGGPGEHCAPVVITTRQQHISGFDHLLMLECCAPEMAAQFTRAIHLVVMDNRERLLASRRYWSQLKEAGFSPRHRKRGFL